MCVFGGNADGKTLVGVWQMAVVQRSCPKFIFQLVIFENREAEL